MNGRPDPESPPRIAPLGDGAILLTLGASVDPALAARVRAMARAIESAALPGVTDVVPAYATLGVYFDPARATDVDIMLFLQQILDRDTRRRETGEESHRAAPEGDASGGAVRGDSADDPTPGRTVVIPVTYDGADLADVAARVGLSTGEVIARHSAPDYVVYCLGFVPGFAYMGELDPALVLPRRAVPRTRVPAGAVAIGGAQTGVYPGGTPGGWHLLGSTELVMFDPARSPAALLQAGDRVRFVPATR